MFPECCLKRTLPERPVTGRRAITLLDPAGPIALKFESAFECRYRVCTFLTSTSLVVDVLGHCVLVPLLLIVAMSSAALKPSSTCVSNENNPPASSRFDVLKLYALCVAPNG